MQFFFWFVFKIVKEYHQNFSLLHIIILVIHHFFGEKWFTFSMFSPFINFSWTNQLHEQNNTNGWWKWGQLWVTNLTWIHYIYMVQTWEKAITFSPIMYFVLVHGFIGDHFILFLGFLWLGVEPVNLTFDLSFKHNS